MKHHLRIVITFSVLLFVGCNASTTGQLGEGAGNQKSSQVDSAFDDVEAKFSELGSEFIRKGRFIPAKNISQIVDGKSQAEVQELLGEPDAIRGSNKQWWFYNINLPLDNFGGSLVCQYRVSFTEGYVISGTAWRRPPCQNLYTSILTKEMSKPESQEVILSGEVLFSYDSAELTRPGKQELDKVAAKFFSQLQRIRVTVLGHTDRIGSETYNLALSQRRADSVEAYLSLLKYAPSNIIAGGRGSREPLVSCEGTIVTPELKDCLAPNRRVQLIIEGLQEEI